MDPTLPLSSFETWVFIWLFQEGPDGKRRLRQSPLTFLLPCDHSVQKFDGCEPRMPFRTRLKPPPLASLRLVGRQQTPLRHHRCDRLSLAVFVGRRER